MADLETITSPEAMRRWVRSAQARGERVGVVPTMGALHAGHLSLVGAALAECDRVVATVFVNPTQFGPGEDFDRYPRDLSRDAGMLAEMGAHAVFAPSVEAMYPHGAKTTIDVGPVAKPLEGKFRPTHFQGVATVVAKLLSVAPADRAYFGRKDYQQTVVVRQLVRDLLLGAEVVVCPTVREPDGLAMSSRNAYLTADERERATALWRALTLIESGVAQGAREAGPLLGAAAATLDEARVRLEYVAMVAEGTVQTVERIEGPTAVLIAARVGATRLIDNLVVTPPGGA